MSRLMTSGSHMVKPICRLSWKLCWNLRLMPTLTLKSISLPSEVRTLPTVEKEVSSASIWMVCLT